LSNPDARSFDSAACAGREGAATGRWRAVVRYATQFARRALPQACALCAGRAGNALVCPACADALPRLPPACPVCALPVAAANVCGACLAHPPPFAATVAPFLYAFPVDRLLQQFKYAGRLAFAEWAAEELAAAAIRAIGARHRADVPAVVAAVPLAPARQRERGFNQAHEIAARVARRLGLPVIDALERAAGGVPQAALRWSARAQNVRGAFACRRDVRGVTVALVDDVMTTGATLAEAACALRCAGAARIESWVVARTLPPTAA
jgi:ComF family protein